MLKLVSTVFWGLLCFVFVGSVGAITEEEAVLYLKDTMPRQDAGFVSDDLLKSDVLWALKARKTFSWAQSVPEKMFLNDVLPYAVVDETRESWRENFFHRFSPYVQHAQNLKEAILAVSSQIEQELGVSYNIKRKKPNQSPGESMEIKMASCTGLSILLVDALRSVGIPARLCGVLTWAHVQGNHNWVEAWDGHEWQMIEYGQNKFNTPWVIENCGLIEEGNMVQAVWASSWTASPELKMPFPMVWNLEERGHGMMGFAQGSMMMPAINVTSRYKSLAYQQKNQQQASSFRFMRPISVVDKVSGEKVEAQVIVKDEKNREVFRGISKGAKSDIRDFLNMGINSTGTYAVMVLYKEREKIVSLTLPENATPWADVVTVEI